MEESWRVLTYGWDIEMGRTGLICSLGSHPKRRLSERK